MWFASIFCTWILFFTFQQVHSNTCNGQIKSFVYQGGINYDVCFWVSTTSSNISGAYSKCVSQGGYPAIVADSSTDSAVDSFLSSVGLGSTEVYIGYNVDTTVPNYRLKTLSGQVQSYENFYSYSINSTSWHCVSMYSSSWFPEKCDQSYRFLCSNLSNILASFQTTTVQATTEYSSTTESTTASPSTSSLSTSTSSPSTSSPSTSSQSSTASSSTTGTTSQGCVCPTNCVPVSNTVTINSTEQLNARIAELKKEIEVEKSTLSSSIRKKTSADDPRPSAKTFGFIGIIIISVVLGGIIALDLPRLVIGIKGFKANVLIFLKKLKK